jgi:beta-mannosidase
MPARLPARLPLDGADWQFKGFYGEDWLWRNSHRPGTRDVRHWHPARVPGSVLHDVWQAGLVPDPYVGLNTLQCEWVADRTWVYKKTFTVPAEYRAARAVLRFEGIDYDARFYLNGELLGTHRGLYTPAVFDVTGRLTYGGDNQLAVVIEPAPPEQPQVGYTSRVRTHKARMNYWWDFCPRLVHQGVWQPVALHFTGPVQVAGVWVQPRVAAPWTAAEVRITAELACLAAVEVETTTTLLLGDAQVAQHTARHALPAGTTALTADFNPADVQLWWPNGHGPQPLYTAQVSVALAGDPDQEPSDVRAVRFGVRHVEFAPNAGAPPDARPYVLVVNGRPIYINGWNWVPLDALYGVPRPAKLDRLLQLAQRAHVNLLRVWGGGLIETEAFYDRCDQLGLLVWQEFIQSSSGIDNDPPRDPAFIAALAAEARQIVPTRRNHPALAVWCGGNELQTGPETPADDSHPMLAALHAVVAEQDPGRAWLPTSPTGPLFSNSLENILLAPDHLHDVHGPWEHQGLVDHFSLYNQGTALLNSEFGVEGLTNRRTLDRVLPPESQWPVTLDSPLWQHLGAWWVKAPRWREVFGDLPDFATLHRAVQWLQADGLRYAVESNRRRQYHNAGSLPWQFNEPYPMAACTSAVDYYAQPKPAYYAVARAYAPLAVTARFDRQAWAGTPQFTAAVWAANSLLAEHPAQLSARLVGLSRQVYQVQELAVSVPANAATHLLSLDWDLAPVADDVFFLDLLLAGAAGQALASNRYVFSRTADLAPLLEAPTTTLSAALQPSASASLVVVENTGSVIALFVWLEPDRPVDALGFVYFSDNHFCLLPGEARTVQVDWQAVPPAERRLSLSAWNAPEQLL